jgi:hypothetical protein
MSLINLYTEPCVFKLGYQKDFKESEFNEAKYAFKYEYGTKGERITVIFKNEATEDEINAYMNKHPQHWYDLIRTNHYVREFYDIDLKRINVPENEFKSDEDIIEYIVDTVLTTRNNFVMEDVRFNVKTSKKDIIVMNSSNDYKISLHIIMKNIFYDCITKQKSFMKYIYTDISNSNEFFNIDMTVYSKNRCFRMLNQTKFGEERYLRLFKPEVYSFANKLEASVVYPFHKQGIDKNRLENNRQFN